MRSASGQGTLKLPLVPLVPAVALLTLLLWIPLVSSPDHSWDDADPEVLNQAWRAARREPLYHALSSPPWTVTNYTPLYIATTGLLLRRTGLSFRPARLVSLAAGLAIAGALALFALRAGLRARDGLWAAALLLCVPAFLYNVARPHPQMLAVALSTWAFLLFESGHRLLADLLSPLLAVAAVYTKQTQVALPLALLVWLCWRDRARLPRFACALAAFALVPAALLEHGTHGAFLDCVLGLNFLPYDPAQIVPVLLHHAGILFLFLGLAFSRLRRRLSERVARPVDLYLVAVAVTTLASLGRAGAHGQYVIELLLVAVLLLLASGGLGFPAARRRWTAVQIALVLLYAPSFVLLEEGPDARRSLAAAPAVRAALAAHPGPILSQQGSFALFRPAGPAGPAEIHVQLFQFAALARVGRWDPAPLLREIAERRLAWAVTEFPIEGPLERDDDRERFTPEIHAALAAGYVRADHIGPYYLYRPKPLAER